MAEKINIEINLEGGAEVEKQLADIGKAGEQAFSSLQSAADSVDVTSIADQFEAVQKTVKNAAVFEQIIQGVKQVEGAFDALGNAAARMATRLTKSLGPLGVFARALGPLGVALGVAGGAFLKFGDSAADSLNGLIAASAKLSLTPQQFDQLQRSLRSLGISADAIGPGLDKMTERLRQDFFPTNVITGIGRFIEQLERMPDSVKRTQLAIEIFGEVLGSQIIAGLKAGTLSIAQLREAFRSITPATEEQILQAIEYQAALNRLKNAWTELTRTMTPITTPLLDILTNEVKQLTTDIENLKKEIESLKTFDFSQTVRIEPDSIADKIISGFKKALDWLAANSGQGQKLLEKLNPISPAGAAELPVGDGAQGRQFFDLATAAQMAQQAVDALKFSLDAVATAIQTAGAALSQFAGIDIASTLSAQLDILIAKFIELARAAAAAAEAAGTGQAPAGAGTGNVGGLARGGFIGGHGTGTSDSNLAWLSRGEFVINAAAVRKFGAGFFTALNAGMIPGFALGGLVPRTLPAFAGGGPVGSLSHVTIQFPGLPAINGLRASSDVVGELQRAAAIAQVRSGGRKPSRYS